MQPNESVDQFCRRVGISRRHFDRMKANGDGPVLTRLGDRISIAPEDAAAWLEAHKDRPSGEGKAA